MIPSTRADRIIANAAAFGDLRKCLTEEIERAEAEACTPLLNVIRRANISLVENELRGGPAFDILNGFLGEYDEKVES